MASEKLIMKVVLVQSLLLISSFLAAARSDNAQVPCYFIFGDSLVDNGNNNYIASLARANYRPYGIDFPGGPTGRFSNGLTFVDVIARDLGFKNYIPPYATANRRQLLRGVNFASAAAGIRDETGRQLGARITMNGQVQNYRRAVSEIVNSLGSEDAAADHLSKCIFTVGMGSNDYLNNYFMPTYYSSSRQYTPEQWANILIQEYTRQLRTIYNYGARKVAIIGVGQVGCSPSELARYSANGATCVTRINDAVQLFNNRIVSLVDDFNNNLEGASFTFINGYAIFEDIVQHASRYGLTNTNEGCCGVGRNNGQITCLPLQTPCHNRDEYVFWDAFHPTQIINELFGRRAYRAESRSDAHPLDISSLARQ